MSQSSSGHVGTAKKPREIPDFVAATVTPCHSPGEVDAAAMQQLAEILSTRGCDGLFVLGSTGEMILVDDDDRRRLVVAARAGTSTTAALMVGIGGFGVSKAVRYAKEAQQDGADFAIAMAPFFQRLSQSELQGYFERIADASPLPLGIYHHLRMTSAIDVDTLVAVSQHPNILLCKDTSNDLDRVKQIAAQSPHFRILQGCEGLILDSLDAGAHGCVSALGGIAPEWHRAMLAAYRSGDTATAQAMHRRILDLTKIFQLDGVRDSLASQVHALKHATAARGWLQNTSSVLASFTPSEQLESAVVAILQRAGLVERATEATEAG